MLLTRLRNIVLFLATITALTCGLWFLVRDSEFYSYIAFYGAMIIGLLVGGLWALRVADYELGMLAGMMSSLGTYMALAAFSAIVGIGQYGIWMGDKHWTLWFWLVAGVGFNIVAGRILIAANRGVAS